MGDGNLGVCRRIGQSWGMGQKAPLNLTCAKDNQAPESIGRGCLCFRRIKASLTPACNCLLPVTLLQSPPWTTH